VVGLEGVVEEAGLGGMVATARLVVIDVANVCGFDWRGLGEFQARIVGVWRLMSSKDALQE
jgi:hypothetical protein